MTPEKHFEKFATEFTRDMEKSDVPFMLAIRPNVTDNPKFFVCAGYGSYIDHANMIAKFVRRFCEDADISVDEMRKLIDKAFDVMENG